MAVGSEKNASDAPFPTMLVVVKAPRSGLAKTRIAVEVGMDEATRIHCWLVERQMRALPADWPVEVHFAPAGAGPEMRTWLGPRPALFAQAEGDLGERLARAVAGAFARGVTGLLVIGGDCPGLDETMLRAAAAALAPGVVVLGPALDGGYYLIGLSAPEARLFAGIPWSTPEVFVLTRRRAEEIGLVVTVLSALGDVDTLADWRKYAGAAHVW